MRTDLIALRGKRTQEEVSKILGISQKSLSAIELGNRNPSIKLMLEFEKLYSKDMKKLFPDIFLSESTTKCGIECKSSELKAG